MLRKNDPIYPCLSMEISVQELATRLRCAHDSHANILAGKDSDFLWPAGTRANTIRSHIIYYKSMLRELCSEQGKQVPAIAMVATPRVVPSYLCAQADGG